MFPDETSLLTGYLLHRWTGLPLLAYFCDLYLEDRRGWEGALAGWLQPRVFRRAARVVAINQGVAEYFRSRYGIEAVCVPACINVPVPPFEPTPPVGRPFVVGYSGNVNPTRVSSLRALVQAVGGDPSFEIRYFTPQSLDYLQSEGLWAANARGEFVADEVDLLGRLASCDVLLLPLTFQVNEVSYEQLATCFGVKVYEYYLSRRPVLLHSPGDYFIARFHRQQDCGLVVDDPSAGAIRAALERLRDDVVLRDRLVKNALGVAQRFAGSRVAATLRNAVDEVTGAKSRGTAEGPVPR